MKKTLKQKWLSCAMLIGIFLSFMANHAHAQINCLKIVPQPIAGSTEAPFLFIDYDGYRPNILMPPATVSTSCASFCLEGCSMVVLLDTDGDGDGEATPIVSNVTTVLTTYDLEISSPSWGVVVTDATWSPSATEWCFTLPGAGVYDVKLYYAGTSTVYIATTITVVSGFTPDPVVLNLNPDSVCTCAEIGMQMYGSVLNEEDYFSVNYTIAGYNDWKATCADLNLEAGGTYPVSVKAFDGCGNFTETTDYIKMIEPQVQFTAGVHCNEVTVSPGYFCLDSTAVSSYAWDWGDGNTSTGVNPGPHTYAAPGPYIITLTTHFGPGLDWEHTETITINPVFVPTITGPATSCGSPLLYTLSGSVGVTAIGVAPLGSASVVGTGTPGQYSVSVIDNSVAITITFYYTDENGCPGVVSKRIDPCCTNGNVPLPVTGPLKTCSLYGSYTTTMAGGTTYSWTITPSSAGTIIGGAGTDEITINWANQTTPATITVTGTDTNGCVQTGTFSVNACCAPISSLPVDYYYTSPSGASLLSAYLGVWPGTIPTTTTITGKTIFVYEDLSINKNMTFTNCNIFVAPGKKLTLYPGITVNWSGGQVREMCDEMWQGIFANVTTSNISANATTFRGAISALVSDNGGNIDLFGCNLYNDYVGLTVKNYTGVHPVTVEKTTFLTTSTLISPYAGRQMHKAIHVENVSNFTIGSTTAANTNTLRNSDYGIYVLNSNVVIRNNLYRKIRPTALSVNTSCCCELGTAVCDVNTLKPTMFTLTDGFSSTIYDNFDNCYAGIETHGPITEKIQYNKMTGVDNGINVYDNNKTIDISPFNYIKNFSMGVFMYDVAGSTILIDRNFFNDPVAGTITGAVGIMVTNAVQSSYKANIQYNEIKNMQQGIVVFNSQSIGTHADPYRIKLYRNNIDYTQLSNPAGVGFTEHNGIRLENDLNVYVKENEIRRPDYDINLAGNGQVGYLRGIKINNAQGTFVQLNRMFGMAEGIHTYGTATSNAYMCNEFRKAYYAFNFEGPAGRADITDQLSGTYPQANKYSYPTSAYADHSVSGYDLKGGFTTKRNWWYYGGAPFNALSALLINSTYGAGTIEDQLTTLTNEYACAYERSSNAGENPMELVDNMIMPSKAEEYNYEFGMFNKLNAYNILNSGKAMLADPKNEAYAAFYAAQQNTPVAQFDTVARSIAAGNYTLAAALNNAIAPAGNFEYNLQRVNAIYLGQRLGNALTGKDSLELQYIARQNGTIGGPGVYHARAILHMYIDDVNGQPGEINTNVQETVRANSLAVTVYPNPNAGSFNLKLESKAVNEVYTVTIVDIQGKLVYGETFIYKGEIKPLSIPNGRGVYMLMLKDESQQLIHHEKLIITN